MNKISGQLVQGISTYQKINAYTSLSVSLFHKKYKLSDRIRTMCGSDKLKILFGESESSEMVDNGKFSMRF